MKPAFFANCELRGGDLAPPGSEGVEALARFVRVVHSFLTIYPGKVALDLPGANLAGPASAAREHRVGRIIRTFAQDRSDLESLLSQVELDPVGELMMIGRIRPVAADFEGPWVTLHRYRVAPRSQTRNRERDLAMAEKIKPGFLAMRSHSNGHRFSLSITRHRYAVSGREGVPTSYGLSRKETPVYLPDIP